MSKSTLLWNRHQGCYGHLPRVKNRIQLMLVISNFEIVQVKIKYQ